MAKERVVVVGGGLAGLAAAMRLAEAGVGVDLISMVPVKRSHSVCAQGGINSVNAATRELGDSEWLHLDDTVYGGAFLQHQPPVKEMCDWGPRIIDLMDRLGVTFNRTPEGYRDQRRFGGTLFKRTAFAGATTGQQLIYALDEQCRRWETEGLIDKYEYWEFLGPVLDGNGVCRGVVAQDMFSMEIRAFPADAVVLATGGCGLIFGLSTMSLICTGGAAARAFRAGVHYANGEFIQVHPTAVPGTDKLRLMSESARGEGGRIWVPKKPNDNRDPTTIPTDERYYFLEERYPKYGNLVPRDIATREIFDVCVNHKLSVEPDRLCVYLDLTELSPETHKKLEGILEIYEKFQGVDPRTVPMKIFPGVHYSMGGLWCDYEKNEQTGGLVMGSPRNHQTNVPGLFAIGEADYQFHGANRLGANSLLSCIFSGMIVGPSVVNYMQSLKGGRAADQRASVFEAEVTRHEQACEEFKARDGDENPYKLHLELGDWMTRNVTVVRENKQIEATLAKIDEREDRYQRAALSDKGQWTNQNLSFTRALGDMIILARVIAKGALLRDECRGAHYKPAMEIASPDADDPATLRRQAETWCNEFAAINEKWLKTTIAEYTPDGVKFSYDEVDVSLIPPRPRTYGLKGAEVIEEVWNERMRGTQRATKPASPGRTDVAVTR
ncbi:MAG: succinate dehydrogenase flavoprotein subunit [Planctomycetes bacterium]|nr:succinate dehydrogenase flavoprotein subunit [Planctomycetota bacterium]